MTKNKLIFFNYPVNTNKICSIITNKSISELISQKVIPKESKYIIEDYIETDDLNYRARLVHVDKLVFDNYSNPTKVQFDMDLLQFYSLELFKEARNSILQMLDNLQLRALAKGKHEIVSMIEKDKQTLRDMPKNVSYTNCKTPVEVFAKLPKELTVNYKDKYDSMI